MEPVLVNAEFLFIPEQFAISGTVEESLAAPTTKYSESISTKYPNSSPATPFGALIQATTIDGHQMSINTVA